MQLLMLKCQECRTTFGVDQNAVGDDEAVTCPICEAEVDVKEDLAIVR